MDGVSEQQEQGALGSSLILKPSQRRMQQDVRQNTPHKTKTHKNCLSHEPLFRPFPFSGVKITRKARSSKVLADHSPMLFNSPGPNRKYGPHFGVICRFPAVDRRH